MLKKGSLEGSFSHASKEGFTFIGLCARAGSLGHLFMMDRDIRSAQWLERVAQVKKIPGSSPSHAKGPLRE